MSKPTNADDSEVLTESQIPEPGSVWVHQKTQGTYTVREVLTLEATGEHLVNYRSHETGKGWLRPPHEWEELVELEGKQVPRFVRAPSKVSRFREAMAAMADLEDRTSIDFCSSEKAEPADPRNHKYQNHCIVLGWSRKGFGFGELTIQQDLDGKVYIDTETCGPEFAKKVLASLVDSAILDTDTHPDDVKARDEFHERKMAEVRAKYGKVE